MCFSRCFAVLDERRLTIVPLSKHSRLTLDSPSTKIWAFLAFFGKIVKCALSPHFHNLIPCLCRVFAESFSLALSLPSRSHYVRTTVRDGRMSLVVQLKSAAKVQLFFDLRKYLNMFYNIFRIFYTICRLLANCSTLLAPTRTDVTPF